jgi:cell division inhibitor SepF
MSFNGKSMQVVVYTLASESEYSQALTALRNRNTVILNVSQLNPQQAQRIIDCMSGFANAIDGQSCWLGQKTYMFTPSGVKLNATGVYQPYTILSQVS